MRAPRWSPRAIAVAVLAVGLLLAFLPGILPARWFLPAGPDAGPASIPARFADYSYRTGSVSTSPPGRAIAIYQHGWGVEFMDFPQAVVAGADRDVYRRLDVAEQRAGRETQGDPAPMLLSPDGTHVAVGDWSARSPDLAVVDLTTGHVRTLPVPGGRSALPLAWSPDSARVAYLTTAEPASPYTGLAVSGDLGLLDVTAGTAELVPGQSDAREAAFSPGGTELAVHRITPDDGSLSGQDGIPRMGGGTIDVVDLDGAVQRRLPVPDGHYLDGPHAWSPDGTLLATTVMWAPDCDHLDPVDYAWAECVNSYTGPQDGVVFLDAAGGDDVPPPLPADVVGWEGLVGWTGTGDVIVLDTPEDPEAAESDLYWLTAVPLDGGEPHRLSAVPGGGNYGVGSFQLATALLPDAQVRDVDAPDRGLLPTWMRVTLALAGSGLTLAVAGGAVRRAGRGRPGAGG